MCIALLTFTSRPSFAMVLAPMCSSHGETVAAPPISRTPADGDLAPTPCERKDDPRLEHRGSPAQPAPSQHVEITPRLGAVDYGLAPAPRTRCDLPVATFGERPAHRRTLERPPR